MRRFEKTHPWLRFGIDFSRVTYDLWVMLGECQSKIEHLAGVPLRPDTARRLHSMYLAKGIRATTAIEGNTLSEKQVMDHLEGGLELPASREYLKQEIDNIKVACNQILRENMDGKPVQCSVERIKEFNRAVLCKLPMNEGVVPGAISDFAVTVGRYLAAPREDCDLLLERLCQWLDGADFQPRGELRLGMAIIKAIVAHLYLAWIHPFGDGNGRTARLLEFDILLSAGVPAPAAHLLSNHYNLTREEYYRQLDFASRSGGDVLKFVQYAAQGLRDGLREQIGLVREQQRDVSWRSYVHERFRSASRIENKRRRDLVLDISMAPNPVKRSDLALLSPNCATAYAGKSSRTLMRDLAILLELQLIVEAPIGSQGETAETGYMANKKLIDAFLPVRRMADRE